jgi:hypothetical protein
MLGSYHHGWIFVGSHSRQGERIEKNLPGLWMLHSGYLEALSSFPGVGPMIVQRIHQYHE